MLFLTSSGSKRKNVIVLRRAKTRIYFLRERVSFGMHLRVRENNLFYHPWNHLEIQTN